MPNNKRILNIKSETYYSCPHYGGWFGSKRLVLNHIKQGHFLDIEIIYKYRFLKTKG